MEINQTGEIKAKAIEKSNESFIEYVQASNCESGKAFSR